MGLKCETTRILLVRNLHTIWLDSNHFSIRLNHTQRKKTTTPPLVSKTKMDIFYALPITIMFIYAICLLELNWMSELEKFYGIFEVEKLSIKGKLTGSKFVLTVRIINFEFHKWKDFFKIKWRWESWRWSHFFVNNTISASTNSIVHFY